MRQITVTKFLIEATDLKQIQISQFIKSFNRLPEILTNLLSCEKIYRYNKDKLKAVRETPGVDQERKSTKILNHLTQLKFGLNIIQKLKKRLKSYFTLAQDITTKNSLQLTIQNREREIERIVHEFKGLEQDSINVISSQISTSENFEELYQNLLEAVKGYEIQIQSEQKFVVNNFFSLNETEISEFMYKFEKKFEKVDKNALNKLIFDSNVSLNNCDDNGVARIVNCIKKSTSDSKFFNEDPKRYQDLARLTVFYKSLGLVVKRLCKVMKNLGIENLAIYTRFRFDTFDFLSFNREQRTTLGMLKKEWKRDRIALNNLMVKIHKDKSKPMIAGLSIYKSIEVIIRFLSGFSDYIERVESRLHKQWRDYNKHFSVLKRGEASPSWALSKEFFDSFNSSKQSRIPKILEYDVEGFSEFNDFIEE